MHRSTRFAAAGLSLGLLAGGATAMVVGVPGFAGASSTPSVLVAQSTGDPEIATMAEAGSKIREALAPLVTEGTITEAQLDAVVAALEAARPERGPRGGARGPALDTVAEALGTTPEAVRDALRAGTSIADQAAAAGVDTSTVVDALVAEMSAKLAAAVEEGRLTQEEADAKLAEAPDKITAMLEATGPVGGPRGHHRRGGFAGRGGVEGSAEPAVLGAVTEA